MARLHALILQHGVNDAKALADPKDRPLIDAAAAVLAAENPGLSICFSGFALTALPHRRLDAGERWERHGHHMTLVLIPGSLPDPAGGVAKVQTIPFGAIARMILLYLQTEAIRTGNSTVALGGNMHQWLHRMNLTVGGKTAAMVKEQARLISTCHLQFSFHAPGGPQRIVNDAIVRNAILVPDSDQPGLWDDQVQLSETFYAALRDHPVPLAEPAIRQISHDSSAIDVYIWLAYRLHSLLGVTPVSWAALHKQFGGSYKRQSQFKPRFIDTLRKALAVYPDANVDIDDDGVILRPSRPPVPMRLGVGLK